MPPLRIGRGVICAPSEPASMAALRRAGGLGLARAWLSAPGMNDWIGLTALVTLAPGPLPERLFRELKREGWLQRRGRPREWLALVRAHETPRSVLEGLGSIAEHIASIELRD
jgi:hypothetical protein